MTSVVVDTNVLIAFLQKGSGVAQVLKRFDRLLVPFAVDAEFRAGLDLATRAGRQHMQVLEDFLGDSSVDYVAAESTVSQKYAMLYHDIWIASAALVRNAPLCTFDRHFHNVPLLEVIEAGAL